MVKNILFGKKIILMDIQKQMQKFILMKKEKNYKFQLKVILNM